MGELKHLNDLTGLPLSSNQKRLWIVYQQDRLNPAYNLNLTYHFEGEIDIQIFRKAISLLFERHYSMFSVFKQKDGVPYIEIVPKVVSVEFIDYSQFPIHSRKEKILTFAGEDLRKHFEIEKGPLYRLYLMKQDSSNFYFHATIHHLIFDGWSMRIFMQELGKIADSLSRSTLEASSPLEFHSFDYAALEEKSQSPESVNKIVEFWENNLKDCIPELKFPYDFPRRNHSSGHGFRESFIISEESSHKLKDLSRKSNSSLFKTMLSVLGILLQKYSGESDINIGVPISTRREHPASENLFGMLVNTSVVRLKIDENISFKEFICYTRDIANNAILNSKIPFDKIVEVVNPERRPNLNPLFQVALSWWNDVIIPVNFNGVIGSRLNLPIGVSPFDITFYIWENESVIEGEIEYNTDILDHETIKRCKENFINLIEKLTIQPEEPLLSIPLITTNETRKILSFTNTRTNYPEDKTIVQLFEDQVSVYGGKIASVFRGETLTYKQLHLKTNQLAHTLRDMGVIRNSPVGLIVEKSQDMIIGIISILKAGGAYLPIDPEYPEQRINFLLNDSGCKLVLAQEKFINIKTDGVLKVNLNSPESFNRENSNIESINSSGDLAYIMYTSGTTGLPKGTLIPQKGVVRLVRDTNYIELTHEDRILLTGAIVFDATTFEIWGALLNGGTLFIAERETILDPKALGEELAKNSISILWLTSALFTQIAEKRTDIFSKLKYLLVGGDVLSVQHINKVRKDNPAVKVINGYGPTENTTFSTAYLIERKYDISIPIGKPISNSTAYIFDKNLNYQPIGVIGELYVGGDGLSLGYLNREDLNSKCFIFHPQIPGERLYKTGDYAKWLPDGNIEFHGRIDNQLKIRGYRVELDEIETVVSEIDGVIETVLKAIKITDGDYKLVAFLNVQNSFNLDIKEIKRRLSTRLPSYMVPSGFKIMHGFPRTINGKIDRNAIEFDGIELEVKEPQEMKALSHTEKAIFKIWSQTLKTNDISLTDNFFEIGGNSMMAISAFSKIESTFKIDLGLRVFFDSPRIKDLAEMIDIKIQNNPSKKNDLQKIKTNPKIIKGEI